MAVLFLLFKDSLVIAASLAIYILYNRYSWLADERCSHDNYRSTQLKGDLNSHRHSHSQKVIDPAVSLFTPISDSHGVC